MHVFTRRANIERRFGFASSYSYDFDEPSNKFMKVSNDQHYVYNTEPYYSGSTEFYYSPEQSQSQIYFPESTLMLRIESNESEASMDSSESFSSSQSESSRDIDETGSDSETEAAEWKDVLSYFCGDFVDENDMLFDFQPENCI